MLPALGNSVQTNRNTSSKQRQSTAEPKAPGAVASDGCRVAADGYCKSCSKLRGPRRSHCYSKMGSTGQVKLSCFGSHLDTLITNWTDHDQLDSDDSCGANDVQRAPGPSELSSRTSRTRTKAVPQKLAGWRLKRRRHAQNTAEKVLLCSFVVKAFEERNGFVDLSINQISASKCASSCANF